MSTYSWQDAEKVIERDLKKLTTDGTPRFYTNLDELLLKHTIQKLTRYR